MAIISSYLGNFLGSGAGGNGVAAHSSSHTNGTDDIRNATAAQKGLATAAQITKLDGVATGADVTGANDPKAHGSSHVGADAIRDATASANGLATAAQITKLDSLPNAMDVVTVAGTTYTFQLTDAENYVRFTNASPVSATVAPDSEVPFAIPTQIPYTQNGAGTVTIVEGTGVTVNGDKVITAQHKGATLIHVAENVWDIHGSLEA